MIELDDPITNLDIGLDEYIVLHALEVESIRHLLLLDVDRILSIKTYGRTVGERIAVWQKLLRKYLTYEKLVAARKREKLPMEEITIHDPVTKAGVDEKTATVLKKQGISSIYDFLNTNIAETFPEKKFDLEARENLLAHQERLWKKELLEQSIEESILIELSGARAIRYEEPEKTVTPEEFIEESLEESGLNPNEIEILEAFNVKTVRDFLDFDVEKVKEVKGYSDSVYIRLASWQKYLRKRLPWKKKK